MSNKLKPNDYPLMSTDHFRTWLLGFSEGIENGAPTPEQWTKIMGQLRAAYSPPAHPYANQTTPYIPTSYPYPGASYTVEAGHSHSPILTASAKSTLGSP